MRGLLRLACKDVSKLVSASMDRRLSVRERVGVRLHLFVCDACRTMVRQFALLRKACLRYADGTEARAARQGWRGCGVAGGTTAAPPEGGGLSAEAQRRIRAALSAKCDSPGFP